jgi:ABC-2 type transport system permease protein
VALKKRIFLWLNRCAAFTYRNYLFAVRNFFAFVELVFWPMMSLLSIGLLGRFLQLQEQALAFVLTGAIAAGILQVAQLDVAYSLLYEVWAKSMKHTLLTPMGVCEHLFGSWVIGMVRGCLIFLILGVSAILFFGFPLPHWGATLIFLLGIFSSALLLGMLVSLLILIFGQKAEITAWMFSYLFMLLCGIYYPVDTLPPFFGMLARMLPVTYFLEYYRQDFGFSMSLSHSLIKGFGLTLFYFCCGIFLLRMAFHQARKNGVIVRLSE